MRPHIHFSEDQIPLATEPMDLLELRESILADRSLVEKIAKTISPSVRTMEREGAVCAVDKHRLLAYVHPDTGETNIFPLLEAIPRGNMQTNEATQIVKRLAEDAALFPKDDTDLHLLSPVTLFASNHARSGKRSDPVPLLSFVRLERRVRGLPVFGPGTRATVGVAHDNTIHSLTHRWKSARLSGKRVEPFGRDRIAKAILEQLEETVKSGELKVDKVILGYYDAGQRYLQPVYRFHATISSKNKELRAADRHVFGFVSIGEASEPLPVLGVRSGEMPNEPSPSAKHGEGDAAPEGDPTVGRYVVRNDSQGWVDSANGFFANLQAASGIASVFGMTQIPFSNSQYYWAEPRLFLSQKDSFVNSVNIALTEVHGNWGLFSTKDNHDDLVFLNTIPSTGYGAGGGGSLAYWILHSCEVIPTATDESTSFDVWWSIFNGLHAAVGYRTEMWINDGVTSPFGLSIGLGAPVISAWLNAVVSDDSYGANDAVYQDDNFNPAKTEPMGRASAVAVCGHGDDTASDIAPLERPTCLTEWWFNN